MTTRRDWTKDVVRRFKDGETVADLAKAFGENVSTIESIIRRTMQLQGKVRR